MPGLTVSGGEELGPEVAGPGFGHTQLGSLVGTVTSNVSAGNTTHHVRNCYTAQEGRARPPSNREDSYPHGLAGSTLQDKNDTHSFCRVCNLCNLALQLSVSLSVYVMPIFKVRILQLEQRRLRDILNFAT